MKKIFITLIVLAFILLLPHTYASGNLKPLIIDGKQVTYRNSSQPVMIPTSYQAPERQFRGVWVSQYAGDVKAYTTKESFQAELLSVLDIMEKYRLNTIIYHLRIMNDALYKTNLSPKSSYVQRIDFEEWDYLEWFIAECHRRGIEFHAWLNPYRIQTSADDPKEIARKYQEYPQNPASKAENILVGKEGAILNPGIPEVRDFLIDVCKDLVANYDIDAIHFDDYFYIAMDQSADINTYNKYKGSFTNIEDWRREQVNLFIKQLSDELRKYNRIYNRQVQLGISPSGIWKDGDGKVTYDENGTAITSGSNTGSGFEHYKYYLYSDTKKWVDEEWIDYIIPQIYWGFTQPLAPHADLVDWWAQVVRYKKVNLYTGIGLYMAAEKDNKYSWTSNPNELKDQILYNSKHPEVEGVCIYSFRHLKLFQNQAVLIDILNEYWCNPALQPEIKTVSKVIPNRVNRVNIVKAKESFILSWEKANQARHYAIYRDENNVDINNPHQLVGIVGVNPLFNRVVFEDYIDTSKDYQYAVVSVSGTNTTSEPLYFDTTKLVEKVDFPFASFADIYFTGTLFPNNKYQVCFKSAQVFAGSPLKYTLYYSYNQENWYEVKERIRESGSIYTYITTYPTSIIPFYFKVVGENELGKIESNIIVAEPEINNIQDYMKLVKEIIHGKINKIIPSGS